MVPEGREGDDTRSPETFPLSVGPRKTNFFFFFPSDNAERNVHVFRWQLTWRVRNLAAEYLITRYLNPPAGGTVAVAPARNARVRRIIIFATRFHPTARILCATSA